MKSRKSRTFPALSQNFLRPVRVLHWLPWPCLFLWLTFKHIWQSDCFRSRKTGYRKWYLWNILGTKKKDLYWLCLHKNMRLIIESNQPVNGLVPHNRQQRCHLNICVWTMRFAQSSAIGPWRRPLPYDASKMRNDLMLLFKLVLEVSVLKYPPKLSKKDFYWHIWDEKENIRAYQILKYNKKIIYKYD